MDLEIFTKKITTTFDKNQDIEHRMKFSNQLAAHYGFTRPELVLFLTHPENAKLTISERCQKLGITEEEYVLATTEPGFQRFMDDYQRVALGNVRLQAIASTSQALTQPRFTYNKNGDEIDNHTLEVEVIKSMAPASQVNVQVNNTVWAEARKLAGK